MLGRLRAPLTSVGESLRLGSPLSYPRKVSPKPPWGETTFPPTQSREKILLKNRCGSPLVCHLAGTVGYWSERDRVGRHAWTCPAAWQRTLSLAPAAPAVGAAPESSPFFQLYHRGCLPVETNSGPTHARTAAFALVLSRIGGRGWSPSGCWTTGRPFPHLLSFVGRVGNKKAMGSFSRGGVPRSARANPGAGWGGATKVLPCRPACPRSPPPVLGRDGAGQQKVRLVGQPIPVVQGQSRGGVGRGNRTFCLVGQPVPVV